MINKIDKIYYYKLKKHYKYVLAKDFSIQTDIKGFDIKTKYIILNPDGLLTSLHDYAWDGASGPAVDTITILKASLVHDILYQLIRMGLLPIYFKAYADKFLQDIYIKDCKYRKPNKLQLWFSNLRSKWIYFGVDKFGKSSVRPIQKEDIKIYEAP